MKVNEQFVRLDDNKFGVKSTYSNDPYLERTRLLREAGAGKLPEIGSGIGNAIRNFKKAININFYWYFIL